jgi:hypothetical protein
LNERQVFTSNRVVCRRGGRCVGNVSLLNPPPSLVQLPQAELEAVWEGMRAAVSAARRYGGGNGAVVVEPASGRVLASSAELEEERARGGGGVRAGAAGHPLRHAVMRVIDAMAARDRSMWPDAPRTASTVTDASGASSLKRRRMKSRNRGWLRR